MKQLRDPGSAITHFIGMVLAVIFTVPLLLKTSHSGNSTDLLAMSIFMASMILLYGASATYHSVMFTPEKIKIFRKIDHMMIFILIAGSYTPICLIVLKGHFGNIMLCAVWGVAIAGILIKAFWITCPKWFSSVLYIAMGWICVFAFTQIYTALSTPAFAWLLGGGIVYTIGGIIYALKLKIFNSKHKNFGSHEIFHLFVMGGSICHYILMYFYISG